ncbi:MAG: transglycosylase domain-containing protein, partial [Clostridia bacterium]|nr:transglycosylase domain-containing protein [Clostridia bacterium]
MYLNVAEMGKGVYGAEAAARAFFDKNASEL